MSALGTIPEGQAGFALRGRNPDVLTLISCSVLAAREPSRQLMPSMKTKSSSTPPALRVLAAER
jgi:hypothetical protein